MMTQLYSLLCNIRGGKLKTFNIRMSPPLLVSLDFNLCPPMLNFIVSVPSSPSHYKARTRPKCTASPLLIYFRHGHEVEA